MNTHQEQNKNKPKTFSGAPFFLNASHYCLNAHLQRFNIYNSEECKIRYKTN